MTTRYWSVRRRQVSNEVERAHFFDALLAHVRQLPRYG
jgi:hypothetical protein